MWKSAAPDFGCKFSLGAQKSIITTMKRTNGLFKIYLSIVAVGLGLLVFAYAAAQQSLRQGANDLPRQLAQDTAAKLASGIKPEEVLQSSDKVDIEHSLAPFVIIYDKEGNISASSADFGNLPHPPVGAVKVATSGEGHAFTWQPKPGVREASVSVKYGNGYVLAGHSLKSVEHSIDRLGLMALVTILGILAAPAIILIALS